MEQSFDSAIRNGSNGASPIAKSCEAAESTHTLVVRPGALLSTDAITTQCEVAGNTDKPHESSHVKSNSQVNPRPGIDPSSAVKEAIPTTELLESSKAEGNSTADANTQPSRMDAPGRVQEDTSATAKSIDSSHMPVQANPQPGTMGAPSKGQEAADALTILTCQEKPFRSPVEVCLVN